MTALAKNRFNSLARVLKSESSVEFQNDGFFYEIFESAERGYVVNVYSSDEKDEDGEYLEKYAVDGGLCSGSARDSIEFML